MQHSNGYADETKANGSQGCEVPDGVAVDRRTVGGDGGAEVATLELIMAAGERLCETGSMIQSAD